MSYKGKWDSSVYLSFFTSMRKDGKYTMDLANKQYSGMEYTKLGHMFGTKLTMSDFMLIVDNKTS